jgi:hypothetical protein
MNSAAWGLLTLSLLQAPVTSPAPALTDVQKLTLIVSIQKVEIARREMEKVKKELEDALKSVQVPGYTFDLQTLTYKKSEAKK